MFRNLFDGRPLSSAILNDDNGATISSIYLISTNAHARRSPNHAELHDVAGIAMKLCAATPDSLAYENAADGGKYRSQLEDYDGNLRLAPHNRRDARYDNIEAGHAPARD